jgi:DNA-binding transcriptional MerR regulator
MKIGEVAERTGIPQRMVRYYEQQGLLTPSRAANGYRDYSDDDVERASRVRGLVQAGLTTRMVGIVLDIEGQASQELAPECTLALAEQLAAELHALQDRLTCLTKSRDAVAQYLERTGYGRLVPSRTG